MPSSALLLLGLFVAIAALGSAAFVQDPNNTQVGFHPNTMSNSVASINPSNGLKLELSMNATKIQAGQGLNVSISEYNTQAEANNVTASNGWPIADLSDGPCGTLNYPIGFAVFQGYYTGSNISSAKSLQLYAPGVYFCPMILTGIKSYGFGAHSSTAVVYGSCTPGPCFASEISTGAVVSEYWAMDGLTGTTSHNLSAGVYTVAAGDEWGEMALLYFIVS